MNFKDYCEDLLFESPHAGIGDIHEYKSYSDQGYNTSERVHKLYKKKITTFTLKGDKIDVVKWKDGNEDLFILGYTETIYDKDRGIEVKEFKQVGELKLENKINLGNYFKYKKLFAVQMVGIDIFYRGSKVAKELYKILVNKLGYTLISDSTQYRGARHLWKLLSQDINMIVDVVDLGIGEVIETNVKLKHGDLDHQYDDRYWSEDGSRDNIVFVLRKIK